MRLKETRVIRSNESIISLFKLGELHLYELSEIARRTSAHTGNIAHDKQIWYERVLLRDERIMIKDTTAAKI